MGGGILLLARAIYFSHNYYQSFLSQTAQDLVLAIFYIFAFYLILDSLVNYIFVKNLSETKLTRVAQVLDMMVDRLRGKSQQLKINKQQKVALLALLVKFFYIPIMIQFTVGNGSGFLHNIDVVTSSSAVSFDNVFDLLVTAIFFLDTLIFGFGYIVESKWLNSSIKSVEPTLLGWLVTLAAYPPFNSVTGQIINLSGGGSTLLAENEVTLRIIQIGILLCNLIFVLATISLGFKASNLTNRGIVSRGTYKYVRHPAYTVKLLGWLLQGFLAATNISYFAAWLGWAFVYFMRAITEERHLMQDPDYQEYCKRVKYRFIPRII